MDFDAQWLKTRGIMKGCAFWVRPMANHVYDVKSPPKKTTKIASIDPKLEPLQRD